ncbi:hypothetical protein [Acetobacter fallax]|nr:hypothetical protein [Acetobacter fallax]
MTYTLNTLAKALEPVDGRRLPPLREGGCRKRSVRERVTRVA